MRPRRVQRLRSRTPSRPPRRGENPLRWGTPEEADHRSEENPRTRVVGAGVHIVLQQAARDAEQAYRNFFASLKGHRKGARIGAPRFRSRKDNRQTIRLHSGGFRLRDNGRLNLAKVGDVRVAWSRDLPSAPTSVTIVKKIGRASCRERG